MKPKASLCASELGMWIGGPTACGKSEVALELAGMIDGEIVTVDSMQVYRGMDIGTAKPSLVERRRVPHHLIDVAGLGDGFSAGAFVDHSVPLIQSILGRSHVPILCGGSGLYFKALLEGLETSSPRNPMLRTQIESTPLPQLIAELATQAPELLESIDTRNERRVIRAVEQLRLGGAPTASSRARWKCKPSKPLPGFFALWRGADDLRQRIDARVEAMMAKGLVDETRRLLDEGLEQNRTAMQAIGYRQIVEHLHGERSLEETIAIIKQRTWQFARRQRNWFERHLPARLMTVDPAQSVKQIAQQLLAWWRKESQ